MRRRRSSRRRAPALARAAHDDAADHRAAEARGRTRRPAGSARPGRSRSPAGSSGSPPSCSSRSSRPPAPARATSISSHAPWPTSPIHRSPVGAVEAHPPRVAQAGQPDLGLRAAVADERVVGGIAYAGGLAGGHVDVDPQDLGQEGVEAAGRCPAGRRRDPPSPMAMYSIPSGPNTTAPPLWLANGWSMWSRIALAVRVGRVRVVRRRSNDATTVSPSRVGVVDEEARVVG